MADELNRLHGTTVVEWGNGRPLLLTHGAMGGVAANFATLAAHLSGRFHLAGANYPGSEGSLVPVGDLSVDELVDQAIAVADARGWQRFPVLGLSLGTTVAMTLAARHPERVSALILTVGFATSDPQIRAFSDGTEALIRLGERTAAAEGIVSAASSPDALADLTLEQWRAAVDETAAGIPDGALAQIALAARIDVTTAARAVVVPTLVVVGGQDRIVLPHTTRHLAKLIKDATRVEYASAGHIFSAPEVARWAGDIESFLDQHAT
ncbi:MAG: alpha/beta hydrolase [Propionibacteriales bacterium]|nr:alpha/beta hydrolase [Propionibacteriales bacterium]